MADLPTCDHFSVHEIAPGVHALISKPEGTSVSNSAVIDLGDRTLVVDTFQTLRAADDLLAVTRALTGRSAALVVNSHWHDDHTGGNQLFEGADIVSTARTVELISTNSPPDVQAHAAEIDGYLEFARTALEEAETEGERARAEGWLRVGNALRADLPRFRLTLPNLAIEDRLTVEGAGRRAEILTYGGGHTESDVFVHLPSNRLVIAGDLLWVGLHPYMGSGDAAAWAGILDRMAGLGAHTVVPGHGPPGTPEHLTDLAAYLRAVEAIVAEAVAVGLDDETLAALPLPPGSEEWEGPRRFAGSLPALVARRRAASAGDFA